MLNELFETVYVPEAVYKEIVIDSTRAYGKEELDLAISSGVFQLYKVQNSDMVNKMYGKLHEGELEVIIGAKELNLRFVVMDERAARDLAQMFLLKPIGTLGILLHAKRQNRIEKVKTYLDILLAHDFYISKKLYQQVLSNAHEI